MTSGGLDKKALRVELRRRLRAIDPLARHQASIDAARRLTGADAFAQARSIMIFLPLRDEIDARPIIRAALEESKTVTVPRIGEEPGRMLPAVLRNLDEAMDIDAHGVAAPRRVEDFPVSRIDLVVVPGLGFDHQGHRLGRGAGYYDRFLAAADLRATSCGLAFEVQRVPQLPVEAHDVRLDMLVTDFGAWDFRPAGA